MSGKAFRNQTLNETYKPFLVCLFIYSILGILLYLWLGKTDAHAFINNKHFAYSDQFFKYITHVGDGLVPVGLFLVLLLVRYSWALATGLSALLMGVIVQTLKRSVFAGDHRPAMFFADGSLGSLPSIDGVTLMLHHSFPSGHSATAFCICFLMACFAKQKWSSYFFAGLALLIAFSRVYISQHFIQDTIVGGWIGFVIAYLGYWLIVGYADKNPTSKLNGRLWPSK